MVGLIVSLFALLIPSRQPKDNEDNLSFILLTFSIIFVIFSPVIATMTVSGTNIFSATKQYSETYNIVKMQDGDYYKVDKKKDGWKLSVNQYDNATNTYTAREYNTENVWYGTTEDQPYVEVEFLEKKYEVPSWYTIAFLARSPEPEKAIHKITIYTRKEK